MIANACFGDIGFPRKDQQREGAAVQFLDDQFFDHLRLITFLQSPSGYIHSFVLSELQC